MIRGPTQTPIIPVMIGDDMKTFMLWKCSGKKEFSPILSSIPLSLTVKLFIRTSYSASHTEEELNTVLGVLKNGGKRLGILK